MYVCIYIYIYIYIVNATILNGMGVTGKVVGGVRVKETQGHGADCLQISTDVSPVITNSAHVCLSKDVHARVCIRTCT
jgi:hypothetical protein